MSNCILHNCNSGNGFDSFPIAINKSARRSGCPMISKLDISKSLYFSISPIPFIKTFSSPLLPAILFCILSFLSNISHPNPNSFL